MNIYMQIMNLPGSLGTTSRSVWDLAAIRPLHPILRPPHHILRPLQRPLRLPHPTPRPTFRHPRYTVRSPRPKILPRKSHPILWSIPFICMQSTRSRLMLVFIVLSIDTRGEWVRVETPWVQLQNFKTYPDIFFRTILKRIPLSGKDAAPAQRLGLSEF